MSGQMQDIAGYELIRELGRGGMATVYLAIQHALDRKVAIKVMHRDLRQEDNAPMPEFERRFLLEGRTMAKLPHRNIVAVFDIVTREDIAYISMEYLDGGTLSDRMRAGLSLGEAIGIVVQLAHGLEFAHRNGVVHRDLKPSNVMFRDALTPVLTDFGIAKQSDTMATRITQTGLVLGTPTYMSPEQANGGEIDGRSDQYALGVLFYELLTGQPPFVGDTPMAVLMGHALQPPPPLPADLAALQPVFDRLLAKKPADRFANLRDFVLALRGLIVGDEALTRRLRENSLPNQSTSDQLRMLGFSGEYATGDGLFALPPLLPTGTGTSGRVTVAREAASWRPSRPQWIALAAAGALVLGLGLWFALKPHGLSPVERELVQTLMREAGRLTDEGHFVDPPGANAFEDLQKVLQKDPTNAEAQALVARIGQRLREDAQRALDSGDLTAAAERINEALLVQPEDDATQKVAGRITAEGERRGRAQRVADLLQRAERAPQRGGANGSIALLRAALAIEPTDPTATQRLKAITDSEYERVRKLIAPGRFDEAAQALAALRADFGDNAGYAALEAELAQAREARERNQRIADLVGKAQTALAAGRLDEPGGDNAIEFYEQAAAVDASNTALAPLANRLARRAFDEAREARRRGDNERALTRADIALRLDPKLTEAASLRSEAETALGARRAAIANRLAAARSAIGAGRLLPPDKDNARDLVEAVLRDDPGNTEATALKAELPRRIAEALRKTIERGELDAAARLFAAASPLYPGQAELDALGAQLRQRENAQAAAKARAEREQRIAELMRQRPLPAKTATDLAQAIASLRAERDDGAERLAEQLERALESDLGTATTPDAVVVTLAAIDATITGLGRSPALTTLRGEAERRRDTLLAERQKELEAQGGELVINALPWGRVEQVLDAARQPVALPDERSTPLQLKLPPGVYYVTVRHPDTAKPMSVQARVQPRQRAQATATFTNLGAEEYLRNAGL